MDAFLILNYISYNLLKSLSRIYHICGYGCKVKWNGCRGASLVQRPLLKLSRGGVLNGEPVQTTADEVMAAEEQAWSARLNTAEGFPPPRTWIWIFLVETVFVFQPRAPGN